MVIEKLNLTNFRSYKKSSFNFSSGATLIVGPNTAGKTNILEAIYLLASGKSLRADYDRELIKKGNTFTRIEGTFLDNGAGTSLTAFIEARKEYENLSRKYLKVNGVGKSLSHFLGNFQAVFFGPEDIILVTNSPSLRRKYLDAVLTQVSLPYRRNLSLYQRVLRQRNRLLEQVKEGKALEESLDFWDEKLVAAGTALGDERNNFFEFLATVLPELGKGLNGNGGPLSVHYFPRPLSQEYLKRNRKRDIAAGATLGGPHREDFAFFWKDSDLSKYGSRGEQRTAVLALKMAELEFIFEKVGKRPTLLSDDIFSELDSAHREKVASLLGAQQTIITTTDEALAKKVGLGEVARIWL